MLRFIAIRNTATSRSISSLAATRDPTTSLAHVARALDAAMTPTEDDRPTRLALGAVYPASCAPRKVGDRVGVVADELGRWVDSYRPSSSKTIWRSVSIRSPTPDGIISVGPWQVDLCAARFKRLHKANTDALISKFTHRLGRSLREERSTTSATGVTGMTAPTASIKWRPRVSICSNRSGVSSAANSVPASAR